MTQDTRDRLIRHAASLFQQRGYHGVGLNQILSAARLPKGSLYHHFKKGKADLAVAAAEWASAHMLRIVSDAFTDANSFADGFATLCHKLAKLFDIMEEWHGCPISTNLIDGPENGRFRDVTARIFEDWITAMTAHGVRLGLDQPVARQYAMQAFIAIQGGWTVARAERNSAILRKLPQMFAMAAPEKDGGQG